MKTIELLTNKNPRKLDDIAEELASIYIKDFALPPWNEVSKCPQCGVFSAEGVGTSCVDCATIRQAAYTASELYEGWRYQLEQGDIMELAYSDGQVTRATVAGVVRADELYELKYQDVPVMQSWIAKTLPTEFVYIYDTFADISRQQSGNLVDRGSTLGRLASAFSGLPITTRTLQPSIIRATVRDLGFATEVYIGSQKVGLQQAMGAKALGTVPDRRTVLVVEGGL